MWAVRACGHKLQGSIAGLLLPLRTLPSLPSLPPASPLPPLLVHLPPAAARLPDPVPTWPLPPAPPIPAPSTHAPPPSFPRWLRAGTCWTPSTRRLWTATAGPSRISGAGVGASGNMELVGLIPRFHVSNQGTTKWGVGRRLENWGCGSCLKGTKRHEWTQCRIGDGSSTTLPRTQVRAHIACKVSTPSSPDQTSHTRAHAASGTPSCWTTHSPTHPNWRRSSRPPRRRPNSER